MAYHVAAEIRVVLFDIDDTLLDHERAARVAAAEWLRQDTAYQGRSDDDLFAVWMAGERRHYRRFERGEISHLDQRCERVREYLPRLADASRDRLLAEFEVFLDIYAHHWWPVPGAVDAVERMEAAGRRVAFLSNAELGQQQRKLAAIGLGAGRPLFTASHLVAGKPDQRAFAATCAGLGVAACEVLMVGDSPTSDYAGARAAGLDAVLVAAAHHAEFTGQTQTSDKIDSAETTGTTAQGGASGPAGGFDSVGGSDSAGAVDPVGPLDLVGPDAARVAWQHAQDTGHYLATLDELTA